MKRSNRNEVMMKVLGITGGVGSGKSLVLSYLQEKSGVVVYEADQIARMEQEPGTKCFQEIVSYFGEEIIADDGTLNRSKLGEIVFRDSEKLEKLNEIVHPRVRDRILELIQLHEFEGIEVFVLEAAILLEGDYDYLCDQVWYIYCDTQVRFERLQASRNYTITQFRNICARQMSMEEFRDKCHVVIDNSGDCTELQANVERHLHTL